MNRLWVARIATNSRYLILNKWMYRKRYRNVKTFAVHKCGQRYAAVSRKVVGKKCTRHSRKVIWDMINTLFLTLQVSNPLLFLSSSTRKHTSMASRDILSNFFEGKWTQNYPQYLTGLSRALFPTTFLEIPVCATVCACFSASTGLSRRGKNDIFCLVVRDLC